MVVARAEVINSRSRHSELEADRGWEPGCDWGGHSGILVINEIHIFLAMSCLSIQISA